MTSLLQHCAKYSNASQCRKCAQKLSKNLINALQKNAQCEKTKIENPLFKRSIEKIKTVLITFARVALPLIQELEKYYES